MPEIGVDVLWLWDGTNVIKAQTQQANIPNLRVSIYEGSSQAAVGATSADALPTNYNAFRATGFAYLFNGTTWDRVRSVGTLKPYYAAALATNTLADVWTPAAGKKFRLRGLNISSDCGAGKQIEIVDEAAVIMNIVSGVEPFEINFGPNGYLSAAADQDLKIRHQKGANAIMSVNAWGNEE